jgi:DNA-binding transcriptional MerR regulator
MSHSSISNRSSASASSSVEPPKECVALTIDELAAKTGVPSRTIRFYQAKGALPPPEKRGRVAFYNQEHIDRLKLVAQLQDRGISLRAIRDLVGRLQNGEDSVNEWLGVGEQLRASWVDDEPRLLTEEQLKEQLGPSYRPGLIAELERSDFIRRDNSKRPSVFLVPSWAELQIVLKLDIGGVDAKSSRVAADIMRASLTKMAHKLVSYFHEYLNRGIEQKRFDPENLGRTIEALRTIWMEATNLILAREIERAINERADKGELLWPARRH